MAALWTRVGQLGRILIFFFALSLLRLALPWPSAESGVLALPVIGLPEAVPTANALAAPHLRALSAVPQATAGFLAAYSRGDESTADQLASPLYRAEWERLGLSAEARTRLVWPDHRPGEPFQEVLRFTFVGGVADSLGFGHLLFASRPALPGRPATPSVFRVDVDPAGRVIWLELVWHFGDGVPAVRSARGAADPGGVPLPAAPCCASLLFGAAAVGGSEGYYAYSFGGDGTPSSGPSQTPLPTLVRFFAVDASGQIRPDAWSYGQAGGGLQEYGKPSQKTAVPRLDAQNAALLHDYLETLD